MRKSRKLKLTKKHKIRKNKTRKLRRIKKIRGGVVQVSENWRIFEYNAFKFLYYKGSKPVILYKLSIALNPFFFKKGLYWWFTDKEILFKIEDMPTTNMGNGDIIGMYKDLGFCEKTGGIFKKLNCDPNKLTAYHETHTPMLNNTSDVLEKILTEKKGNGIPESTAPNTPDLTPRQDIWVKFYDENYKSHYWYNSETGASQWEDPFNSPTA